MTNSDRNVDVSKRLQEILAGCSLTQKDAGDLKRLLDEAAGVLKGNKSQRVLKIFYNAAGDILKAREYIFFSEWLKATLEMAGASWETLWIWLNFSPYLRGAVGGDTFRTWTNFCISIYRYSINDCHWIIRNSPDILGAAGRAGEEDKLLLLKGCRELVPVSWPASIEFFKSFPILTRFLKKEELGAWHKEGLELSRLDTRIGKSYFASAAIWTSCSFDIFDRLVAAGKRLSEKSAGTGIAFFETVPDLAQNLGESAFMNILPRWAEWTEKLLAIDPEVAACFVKTAGRVIPGIKAPGLDTWAQSILQICPVSKKAAMSLISAGSTAFDDLRINEYENWYRSVLADEAPVEEKICEAFSLQTRESKKRLLSFRRGVSLGDVVKSLRYFAVAYFDREVMIKSSDILPKEFTGRSKNFATCDGKRIYLPGHIGIYPAADENLKLYKRLLIHEMAHLLEGTYGVKKEDLAELAGEFDLAGDQEEIEDINQYCAYFDNYNLIKDLFELVEDARVEKALAEKYPEMEKELKPEASPAETGAEGEDFISRSLAAVKKLSLGRGEGPDAAGTDYFAKSFEEFTGSRPAAADSLRLATRWYFYIKNRTENLHIYKSYGLITQRGSLCPALESLSGKIQNVYRQSGILNENYITKRVKISHPAINDDNRNAVTEYLVSLLTGYIKEEEDTYRAVADYDEWDCTLSGYKPEWARVRESLVKPSSASFVNDTLGQYYGLVSSLKRYFALLRPDRFRRYRRQEDGDQEDIDAMVEAWVDKRMGAAPSGGLYIRRDKRVRDVAVAFLIDLSDSTNQKLDGKKTILDVEKESVAIMAEALEVLGDKYAIYGFNSEGRERVNFYIVKEFFEDYSLEVKQRFGGLKGGGQTRMGAAVRHAVKKLEKVEASVRLLIFLSDGRPYDTDYCAEFGPGNFPDWLKHDDLLYAQEDTRMAIGEAKMKLITPFCITVDRKGKEYLEKILGTAGYVVIDNVDLLPVKLPEIYKRLTV